MNIVLFEIAVCCGNLLYSIEYHHIHSSLFKKLSETLEGKEKKRKEREIQTTQDGKFKYL